jgi:hypothetical protein
MMIWPAVFSIITVLNRTALSHRAAATAAASAHPPNRRVQAMSATAHTSAATSRSPVPDTEGLSLWRLHAMRVGYAVMGVGLAVVKWPLVINHDQSAPLFEGVVAVLLTAMSLLAFLGLRYPVRLLPILIFECLWKVIWLGVVALPAVAAGHVDQALSQVIVSCSLVVIVLAVVPWRYVWHRYVMAKGDRWR